MYTPFRDGDRFNAQLFNQKFDELSTNVLLRTSGVTLVTNWISLTGLTSYVISGIPTDLKMLKLIAFARVAFTGSDPRITINGDVGANYKNNEFADGGASGLGSSQSITLSFSITTDPSSEFGVTEVQIFNQRGNPQFFITKRYYNASAGRTVSKHDNVVPISTIEILSGVPAFEAGSKFRLYGVRG